MMRQQRALTVAPTGFSPAVNRLFYGCKNALAVWELKVCLATGAQVQITHTPAALYPALLLLTLIDPTIVDAPDELRTLVSAEYQLPKPGFWHPEGHLVSNITLGNLETAEELRDIPEAIYIFTAYEELTNEHAATRLGLDTASNNGAGKKRTRQKASA